MKSNIIKSLPAALNMHCHNNNFVVGSFCCGHSENIEMIPEAFQ